jgi:hypothetical protein
MHAPWFWWEAIILSERPFLAPALLEKLPEAPTAAADAEWLALILRLVPCFPANAAAEARAAVDDATTPTAGQASEPVPAAAEVQGRGDDGDDLIDVLRRAAMGRVAVAQSQAIASYVVADCGRHLPMARPSDASRIADVVLPVWRKSRLLRRRGGCDLRRPIYSSLIR